MKNLLIGNGVNIQYGGLTYSNKQIIIRAMEKIKSPDIKQEINGIEVLQLLKLLHKELSNIFNNEYDIYAITSIEKSSLSEFNKRYKENPKKLKIYDVGFEDYFLIFELFCRKNKVVNPDLFNIRGLLKRFFIDSIFNDGKIQKIFKQFPPMFKVFLEDYTQIFTTNYDKNIELFLNKKNEYLHGAFHIIDEVYNPNSFRNRLSDNPSKETPIIKGFEHLFSNAITSFSGFDKDYVMNLASQTNSALKKFSNGINHNKDIAKEIESWSKSDERILRNLGEAILLKNKQSELSVNDYYPINSFKEITNEITIIGLSPFNDNHIFKMITDNKKIDLVTFYYYTKEEIDIVKSLLINIKNVKFKDVKQFWAEMNDKHY